MAYASLPQLSQSQPPRSPNLPRDPLGILGKEPREPKRNEGVGKPNNSNPQVLKHTNCYHHPEKNNANTHISEPSKKKQNHVLWPELFVKLNIIHHPPTPVPSFLAPKKIPCMGLYLQTSSSLPPRLMPIMAVALRQT